MQNFLWLDLETTGLDPRKHQILEVHAVITGPSMTPKFGIDGILTYRGVPGDPVAMKMHEESGLLNLCKSTLATESGRVEQALVNFILDNHKEDTKLILAGNSIHFDRSFIKEHWPKVDKLLSYRMLDVSAIKVAAMALRPDVPEFEKKKVHRAEDDIQESLAEFEYYRQLFFQRKD